MALALHCSNAACRPTVDAGGQIANSDSAEDIKTVDLTQCHYLSGPIRCAPRHCLSRLSLRMFI